MDIFQRMKDLREDRDLSQEDIAKVLQTTQEQVSKYETGRQMMGIDKYVKLAKYYNVSLDYLTGLIDTPKKLYWGEIMDIFQRMKDLREDHDLTQADVAKILQTTREQVSKYETGRQMMGADKYIKLAKYYNVSLDYLMGLIDTPKKLYWKTEPPLRMALFSFGTKFQIWDYRGVGIVYFSFRGERKVPKESPLKESTQVLSLRILSPVRYMCCYFTGW